MSSPQVARSLVEILRALPPSEMNALISRLGIRIDKAKRIDTASQVARALVQLPDLRDPSRLPPASVELLHRVAEWGGSLTVTSIPPALEPLLARGLMFARGGKGAIELLLPPAYLLQLRSWEGENPRGLRALLAQAPFETTSAIAGHYLGRPATPPIALSLEGAWEVLGDPVKLKEEIAKLAPMERRVLEGIERDGGEVDTEELLELEREPLRLRTATGATPSRRGVGFSLERRGLLIPVHPNRHVVPAEVAAIIGAAGEADRQARRLQVKTFVLSGDHAPRRARFALDPVPLAVALAVVAREPGNEVRPGIGTPKSLASKLATRFGRDPGQVAIVIALSRAVGLWDASATSPAGPPGSFQLRELGPLLFNAWRKAGVWDEARSDPEALRVAADARDVSPIGVMRETVIEALKELGEGRWIPWESLAGYLRTDHRMPGVGRLLRRWAERVGAEMIEPMEVARRIVLDTLPALGIIDIGEGEGSDAELTLRLTPRGRTLLADRATVAEPEREQSGVTPTEPVTAAPASHDASADSSAPGDTDRSRFLDTHVLRLGMSARVHAVISLASFVEVARATDTVDLLVAPQTLARALSAGIEADLLRQRIEAIAPLPESLSRTLAQASVVVGRGTFIFAAGFLWVEDHNVRELLRTRRPTAELFVDPSPPPGLIVAPGVDLDRLTRRCRTVGVELISEGQVVRARTLPPPRMTPSPGRVTPSPGRVSYTGPRVTPSRGSEKKGG